MVVWETTFAIHNSGDVTCKATIPIDMQVEARFLAKEDGIVAGIALAEMVFKEVDPSLKVLKDWWFYCPIDSVWTTEENYFEKSII